MFVNIKDVNYRFSNCQECKTSCCSGDKFFLIPLILEDFELVYKNFPILFISLNDEFRAVIILNQDGNACKYLKDGKCQIYEQRPPACKIYPITPYYDEFFVDSSCDAVNEDKGEFLCSSEGFSKSFYHRRLDSFLPKYEESLSFFKTLENQCKSAFQMREIEFFIFDSELENEYIAMHKESLSNLDIEIKR